MFQHEVTKKPLSKITIKFVNNMIVDRWFGLLVAERSSRGFGDVFRLTPISIKPNNGESATTLECFGGQSSNRSFPISVLPSSRG